MNVDPFPWIDGVAELTDVDGIGLLCEPCHVRGWPPHYDYLRELLRAKIFRIPPYDDLREPLAGEDIMHSIAMYAYPDYAAAVRDV